MGSNSSEARLIPRGGDAAASRGTRNQQLTDKKSEIRGHESLGKCSLQLFVASRPKGGHYG
jgi:hypothetical protein